METGYLEIGKLKDDRKYESNTEEEKLQNNILKC